MTSASPSGRIARQTCMALIGVFLAAVFSKTAVGVATSGTMLIYCGLLDLYTTTKAQATVLVKKRILLQFLAIPVAVVLHFVLYSIPVLRPLRWLRIFLAEAVCVPTLLTINHRKKLGLSEIGLLVSPVMIGMTFDTAPTFFITRLTYTTVAILISFILTTQIITIRYDLQYEKLMGELRALIERLMQSPEHAVSAKLLQEAREKQASAQYYLDILKSEAFTREKMSKWQKWIPVFVWEMECDKALFLVLEKISCEPSSALDLSEILDNCFAVHKEIMQSLQNLDEGFIPNELPALPQSIYASAGSKAELNLLHAVVCYYAAFQTCPFHSSELTIPAGGQEQVQF